MSMGLFEVRMIFPLSNRERDFLNVVEDKKIFELFGISYKVDFIRYNFSSDGFRDSVDIRAYSDEL